MDIFLRMFYQSADENVANEFATFLTSELSDLCRPAIFKIEKYWKMPEYFEVSLDLDAIDSEEAATKIMARLGNGWVLSGSVYIWIPGEICSFISAKVKWASLEVIE